MKLSRLVAALLLMAACPVYGEQQNEKAALPARESYGGRRDCYGDPLPTGAIARLGTVRFRRDTANEIISAIAFSPNGNCWLPRAAL
jgi:hypothetical protein